MQKITLENGKVIKISDENYKALSKGVKDELDVSELFVKLYEDKIALINSYNKKQVMYYDEYGLEIISNGYKHDSNLNSFDKKAVLRDGGFGDIKVGDFFRLKFNLDESYSNIRLCIGINNEYIYFIKFLDKNNIIESAAIYINNGNGYKLQKVYFKDVD